MNKVYPSGKNKNLVRVNGITVSLLLVLCFASFAALAQSDSLLHKRFGRAALLWTLTQTVPWTYDRFVRNVDWAHVTLNILKHHINPGNWAWDNDGFTTNQFGHPTHGSVFFNTFRSNGYSFWQSVPASFAGSYVWETAAETQAPSINDLINTGFGGVVLGETVHRISGRLIDNGSKGVKRQVSRVLAFIINPAGGLNRVLDGKWAKTHTNTGERDTTPINAEFDLGLRDFKVNNQDGNFGWYSHVKMRYGSPFENYKGPFSYIYANAEFGKDDTTAVNIITIYGSLAGWRVALTDSCRHTSILTANFDYINNKAFFYSSESLRLNLFSEYRLPGKIKITTVAGLGPLVLATVPDPYLYQGRTYDYGSGAGGGLNAEISFNNRFFYGLNYRGWWVKTLSGNSSEYFLHTVTSEFRYRLTKDFSICAEPGYFTLKGHFKKEKDTDITYPYLRLSVRYAMAL